MGGGVGGCWCCCWWWVLLKVLWTTHHSFLLIVTETWPLKKKKSHTFLWGFSLAGRKCKVWCCSLKPTTQHFLSDFPLLLAIETLGFLSHKKKSRSLTNLVVCGCKNEWFYANLLYPDVTLNWKYVFLQPGPFVKHVLHSSTDADNSGATRSPSGGV